MFAHMETLIYWLWTNPGNLADIIIVFPFQCLFLLIYLPVFLPESAVFKMHYTSVGSAPLNQKYHPFFAKPMFLLNENIWIHDRSAQFISSLGSDSSSSHIMHVSVEQSGIIKGKLNCVL